MEPIDRANKNAREPFRLKRASNFDQWSANGMDRLLTPRG